MRMLLPAVILTLFTLPTFAQNCSEEIVQAREVTTRHIDVSVKILESYREASEKSSGIGRYLVQMAQYSQQAIGSNEIADAFSKSISGIDNIPQVINNLPSIEPAFSNLAACLSKCDAQINAIKSKHNAIVDYQKSTLPHFTAGKEAIINLLAALRAAEDAGAIVPMLESQKLADRGEILDSQMLEFHQKYNLLSTDFFNTFNNLGSCSQDD